MRQRLTHARLLTLLMLVRLSGALAYRRELGLVELHRRLIALVGNYDGLTSVELVALSGQEKAQISRAVKALTEAGIVARSSLRAKVMLSPAGQAVYDRIMAIASTRDAAITRGVPAAELARLDAMTARLIDRAALLLRDERQISEAAAGVPAGQADPAPLLEPARLIDKRRALARMVVPPLITLVSYLQRSATIAYRRETDLSPFGWRVLSQIGEYEPITLARLITRVGRDKSQIGRAVRHLEATGQIERTTPHNRRDIVLTTTAKGGRTYLAMCEDAVRREEYLFVGISDEERAAFGGTIRKLTANAEQLLAAERAAERPAAA